MNTREIRKRIASIKKTQQITKAMKMVAAVRYRKALQNLTANRPYRQEMEYIIGDLIAKKNDNYEHPYFIARKKAEKELLILITSDKGFCGSFNSTLLKNCLKQLRLNGSGTDVIALGKKGRDFLGARCFSAMAEYNGVMNALNYVSADKIVKEILLKFFSGNYKEVTIMYNEFKVVTQAKTKIFKLLPLATGGKKTLSSEFIFEPDLKSLLEELLPKYISVIFYGILLESNAAEQGLRMTSMEQATKNTEELMKKLTLQYNKVRQGNITKELNDLVGGAAAVS